MDSCEEETGELVEETTDVVESDHEYEESQRAGRTVSLSADTDVEVVGSSDFVKLRRIFRKPSTSILVHDYTREGSKSDDHLTPIPEGGDPTPTSPLDFDLPLVPGKMSRCFLSCEWMEERKCKFLLQKNKQTFFFLWFFSFVVWIWL